MTDQEFVALLDERMKTIARDVLRAIIPDPAPSPASDEASAKLRKQFALIKAKEHITVKEAAFVLSCSESHTRKLVMLARKGKTRGEHLAAITRIVLNTGIRPPKEVLAIKKEHFNLADEACYRRVEQGDVLVPPKAVLVAKGKDGKPRVLPLNRTAQRVLKTLVEDRATGEWLFTNREGEPIEAIKKGSTAACHRAGIEDLRSYDPRHTFATRLLERGVHHFVISALLGHATPMTGFGYASRMTPGYAHATWDSMVAAVATLEQLSPLEQSGFTVAVNLSKLDQERKVG